MTTAVGSMPARVMSGGRRQEDFNARVRTIDVFVQMRFDNAVIVQSQTFAQRILRNFEPSIDVPAQGGRKIKADRERKTTGLQVVQEGSPMGKRRQRHPDELSHLGLVRTAGR